MTISNIIIHPASGAGGLRVLIDRARDELRADAVAAEANLRRALDVISQMNKGQPIPAPGSLAGWRANRVARYVEDHLHERLSVECLAQLTRLSARQFSRAFKASFGVTPAVYVQCARLARVRARLLEIDEPLSLTARACGFSDETQLCRVFRTATGYTPKAWRRARSPSCAIASNLVSGRE